MSRMIGCDRCSAVFPLSVKRTELWIFELDGADGPGVDMLEPVKTPELCPACRSDLDVFLTDGGQVLSDESAPKLLAAAAPQAGWQNKLEQRTCEICGRVGVQRFVKTDTGYRCAPTAKKCPGNKPQPGLTPAPPPPADSPIPAGVTAKCQDCTRTWTLTGTPLSTAVEMHELKHSHVVSVAEGAIA
jgi:hypothetical protein